MPIFEYGCKSCGRQFELLVRSDTRVACPSCGGEEVAKKFSLFSSRVARHQSVVPPCHSGGRGCDLGRCGSGSCGVE
jgi:putative FmdB family regulatory protein